jgi:multisubunit Na+/H+ antiporter MnhB subunit
VNVSFGFHRKRSRPERSSTGSTFAEDSARDITVRLVVIDGGAECESFGITHRPADAGLGAQRIAVAETGLDPALELVRRILGADDDRAADGIAPYSAPCGPFSTSICWMSKISWLNSAGLVSSTPSTSTATLGSLLRACEMPRTTTKALPAFCVSTSVMFGTSAMKSPGLSMPAFRIVASVNTLIVTGTSWKDSSRLRAVTTTSSISWLCATAGVATAAASSQAASMEWKVPWDVFIWISGIMSSIAP